MPEPEHSSSGPLRKALLVVITYNSFPCLPDVVASIGEFERNHPGNHVVVVENSSDDRVRDFVKTHSDSPRVAVRVSPTNEGFSHGVNFAYRLAQELWGAFDYVVLLNPDVVAAGRVVCELVNRAAARPGSNVGVWGAVLRDEDGVIDRGCARRVWNRRRFFSHLVGYHDLVGVLMTSPRSLSETEIRSDQTELAMVSGGLMCIDTRILGPGMDTILPMYLEDQEICMRSLASGSTVRLHPDLELLHLGGMSRKSVTAHERALRIMELVDAPVLCMSRLQGYSHMSLRLTVLLGGLCRYLAAPAAGGLKILFRRAHSREVLPWVIDQQRLAAWMIAWSIKGPFHNEEISLDSYFKKYVADG